jgi:lipoate-protein ligase A
MVMYMYMYEYVHVYVHVVCVRSGGGAVYEDLGNSVFTFIGHSPTDEGTVGDNQPFLARVEETSGNFRSASVDNNHLVLLNALSTVGIPNALLKGRNDMVIQMPNQEYRKISGAAFQKDLRRELLLHHGTMLLDVEMGNLGRYLSPDKAKLQSKGIKSVVSRVTNLVDVRPELTHALWCDAMVAAFLEHHSSSTDNVDVEVCDESMLAEEPALAALYEEYCSWEFIYGTTPAFTHQLSHRFPWGLVDLRLQVEDNHIAQCDVFGDVLEVRMMDALPIHLAGVEYSRDAVAAALDRCAREAEKSNEYPPHLIFELKDWLADAM